MALRVRLQSSSSVPPELVREIFAYLYNASTTEEPDSSTKPSWSIFLSLTLASKMLRTLALEAWFYTLSVRSPSDLQKFQDIFPEGWAIWPRELHCIQEDQPRISVWNLGGFKYIHKIRLDWLSSTMMPFYHTEENLVERPLFQNVTSTIRELDLRGLGWPSPFALQNLEASLPDLEILRLQQRQIWCGLCHTCSVVRFQAPGPEAIIYEGGLGLPMHYARVLGSVAHLHSVYITIPDFGSGKTILSNDSGQNKNLWAGECDRCMTVMYEDDAFREQWVARKKGLPPPDNQSALVYVRPPALKRVEWRFWKTDENEGDHYIEEDGGYSDES